MAQKIDTLQTENEQLKKEIADLKAKLSEESEMRKIAVQQAELAQKTVEQSAPVFKYKRKDYKILAKKIRLNGILADDAHEEVQKAYKGQVVSAEKIAETPALQKHLIEELKTGAIVEVGSDKKEEPQNTES